MLTVGEGQPVAEVISFEKNLADGYSLGDGCCLFLHYLDYFLRSLCLDV
jgi:hypothetical protein